MERVRLQLRYQGILELRARRVAPRRRHVLRRRGSEQLLFPEFEFEVRFEVLELRRRRQRGGARCRAGEDYRCFFHFVR